MQSVPIQDMETRLANVQLEIEASIARLDTMRDTLCASVRDRLTRRVNRIPANLRDTPIVELLAPAPIKATAPDPAQASELNSAPKAVPTTQAARSKAAPKKATTTKKAAAATTTTTTATRKTRNAPATAPAAKPVTKPAPKPTTKVSTSPPASRHTAMRAKKRGSDEMSGDNKENSPVPEVNNKRIRTAAAPKAAPTTRATRAASRQQVLSPKNNNPRQKATKSTTRPR